jgi:hypothetical protein
MAEAPRIRTHLVFCIRVRVPRYLDFAPLCSSGEMFEQHGGQKIPTCRSIPHVPHFPFTPFIFLSFPLALALFSFFISLSVNIALAVSWGITHIPYGRIVLHLSDRVSDSWWRHWRGILLLFLVCYPSIPVE